MTRSYCCIAVIFFCSTAIAQAAEDDADHTLASLASKRYSCSMLVPIATAQTNTRNRAGAISDSFVRIYRAPVRKPGEDAGYAETLQIDRRANFCTPKEVALPTPSDQGNAEDVLNYRYEKSYGAAVNIEIKNIITLVDFKAAHIDAVSLSIKDVKLADYDFDLKAKAVLALKKSNACAKLLNKAETRMITGTCTGTTELGVFFDRSLDLKGLEIATSVITAKISAEYMERLGREVPCQAEKPTAPKSDPNPTAGDAKPAAADAAKKKPDVDPKSLKAITVSVRSNGATASSGGSADKPTDPAQPAKGDAKPADAQKPADAIKADANTSDQKCYDYVKYVSKPDAVFGVVLTDLGIGKYSLKQLIKDAQ